MGAISFFHPSSRQLFKTRENIFCFGIYYQLVCWAEIFLDVYYVFAVYASSLQKNRRRNKPWLSSGVRNFYLIYCKLDYMVWGWKIHNAIGIASIDKNKWICDIVWRCLRCVLMSKPHERLRLNPCSWRVAAIFIIADIIGS